MTLVIMKFVYWKKKSEFINACRHKSKLLLKTLKRYDSMDWKNTKEACRDFFFVCFFFLLI